MMAVAAALLPWVSYAHAADLDAAALDSLTAGNYGFEWRQAIVPATLIGIGTVALANTFIRHSSREVTQWTIDLRCGRDQLSFDDYVQHAPMVGSLFLGSIGVKARHSLRDRALIVATSYCALGVMVNVPKQLVDEKRPQYFGHNSFPSGHAATVFMGAELMRIEYGGWYGIGAYTVAVGVGFMRLYNGRHWLHDVVAGAGVGILSARIGQWSAQMWQKAFGSRSPMPDGLAVTPLVANRTGGCYGIAAVYHF